MSDTQTPSNSTNETIKADVISGFPVFPESLYFGVAAKFSELFSQRYESCKEFFYMDFLSFISVILSGRWRVENGDTCTQPRFYLLKVATSAWKRKSQSTRSTKKFVHTALHKTACKDIAAMLESSTSPPFALVGGIGSAEGLADCFRHDSGATDKNQNPIYVGNRRILLSFDEFRRFEKKAKGEGSVLLTMVNELFDGNDYFSATKKEVIDVNDGHLVFVANTTEENYRNSLDAAEMQDGGFLNRWLIVGNNRPRVRKSKIHHPTDAELQPLYDELAVLFQKLPPIAEDGKPQEGEVVIQMTPEADALWDAWYMKVPETDTTARLDAYGYRLMSLLTFVAGKDVVDAEIVQAVLDFLAYQQRIRELYKPIIASNPAAKMEQRIIAQLDQRGNLKDRDLQRFSNAGRDGVQMYKDAIKNLLRNNTIEDVATVEQGKRCKTTVHRWGLTKAHREAA